MAHQKNGEYIAANGNDINISINNWNEILVKDLNLKETEHTENEYTTHCGYILVFAKDYNGNYVFRGVYVQDQDKHKPYEYVYRKVSDTAILYGNPPQLDIDDLALQEAKRIETALETSPLLGRERKAVVKIRENQGIFRNRLLSKYSNCLKCHICGVNITDCLIASHIQPWCDSNDREKIDPDNGLLLCPNHDKLFDSGYISFDENGKILISSELDSNNRLFLNLQDSMKIHFNGNNEKYMKYHREHIFKK